MARSNCIVEECKIHLSWAVRVLIEHSQRLFYFSEYKKKLQKIKCSNFFLSSLNIGYNFQSPLFLQLSSFFFYSFLSTTWDSDLLCFCYPFLWPAPLRSVTSTSTRVVEATPPFCHFFWLTCLVFGSRSLPRHIGFLFLPMVISWSCCKSFWVVFQAPGRYLPRLVLENTSKTLEIKI